MCRDLFGYDAAIDYRAPALSEAIDAACPNGVNVYFDNTSGRDQRRRLAEARGRRPGRHLRHGLDLLVGPLANRPAARTASARQARAGAGLRRLRLRRPLGGLRRDASPTGCAPDKLRYAEDILDGIEACPDALAGLYRGENKGKRLIRLGA